jgi:hypothetical protein
MQLGPCQERAGFLFSHECPRLASHICTECTKVICDEHSQLMDGTQVCIGCATDDDDDEDDEGTEGELPDSWEDEPNPYLASSYYYRDYGYYGHGSWGHDLVHDPNDFTEADGESLRNEGSESFEGSDSFEEDMGGS